jgi:hypothetical protein
LDFVCPSLHIPFLREALKRSRTSSSLLWVCFCTVLYFSEDRRSSRFVYRLSLHLISVFPTFLCFSPCFPEDRRSSHFVPLISVFPTLLCFSPCFPEDRRSSHFVSLSLHLHSFVWFSNAHALRVLWQAELHCPHRQFCIKFSWAMSEGGFTLSYETREDTTETYPEFRGL